MHDRQKVVLRFGFRCIDPSGTSTLRSRDPGTTPRDPARQRRQRRRRVLKALSSGRALISLRWGAPIVMPGPRELDAKTPENAAIIQGWAPVARQFTAQRWGRVNPRSASPWLARVSNGSAIQRRSRAITGKIG